MYDYTTSLWNFVSTGGSLRIGWFVICIEEDLERTNKVIVVDLSAKRKDKYFTLTRVGLSEALAYAERLS